jgi:hypothetical protein
MAIIAVRPGSSLTVTFNASIHTQQAKGPAGRRGSFLHRAVARGTIDSAQFYMAAVRKIDVHRHAGDLRPGDVFSRGCQEPDFLFFRALGQRRFVAGHAGGEVRQGSPRLALNSRVAIGAGHVVLEVFRVIESDGLRCRGLAIANKKDERSQEKEDSKSC